MATCTPMQSTAKSNQSTLFSFMKKKDPTDASEAQKQINFVTPASAGPSQQNAKDVEKVASNEEDKDSIDQNPDIDRLVSCSAISSAEDAAPSSPEVNATPVSPVIDAAPSSPVVDLTGDEVAPTQKITANVVSVTKKRKAPASKTKAAAAPTKSISAAFAAAKDIIARSPSKEIPAADAEAVNAVAATESTESTEPAVEVTVTSVAPAAAKAAAAPKKRVRKPSTKKTEAVESAALDVPAEGEAADTAADAAVESKEDSADKDHKEEKEDKPAAKRSRKPAAAPAKAAPAAVVYPPHVEIKLQSNREKLNSLVTELVNLECCVDYQDSDLEVSQAVDAVLAAAEKLPSEVTAQDAAAVAATAPAASTDVDAEAVVEDQPVAAEPMAMSVDTEAPGTIEGECTEGADVAISDAVTEGAATALEMPAVEIAAPVIVLTAEDKVKALVNNLIRAVIARCIQGRSAPLREVVAAALKVLTSLHQTLIALPAKESVQEGSEMEVVADAAAVPEQDARQIVTAAVRRLTDAVLLSEEVKSLAVRQCYGNRADKTSMFDCTDNLSVWRWEAHSFQHFSKGAQNVIREARAVRGRYSRALKAVFRVLEQQSKQPYSETKVAPLEERAVKALAEVEKAKEKRRELEAKRVADAEDRRRKEELKEQKRLEKEEARRVATEAAAAAKAALAPAEKEKKAPVVNEKAQKKAAELEKAKNAFMSFLKPAAPSTSSSAAPMSAAAPASSSASAAVAGSPKVASATDEEKLAKFEAAMKSEMAMSDIMKYQRQRYQNRTRTRKNRRPTHIELHVTVIVPDPRARNAFDATDNTYSEIQEKRFHNKVRTLAFWEDHRPAYVGTVSRTSRVISGRRPLAKDTELLNYEYDSEEDWEEEVEGEDLNETDEEEEEGGSNELEYDDFFCRDDDYGSDAEGDMGVPLKVCHKNVIEVFGPRYISPSVLPALVVDPAKEELTTRRSEEPISNFTIFDLATGELVSRAAKQDPDSNNLSMYTAVSFATHPAPVMGQFEVKKTAHQGGASSSTESAAEAKPAPAPKGFDESKLVDLVRYVHGKKEGVDKLVAGFHELHGTISKLQIQKRLKDITDKTKHADGYGSLRFMVKAEVLETLSLSAADLEEVIFTPQKKAKKHTAPTVIASSLEDLKTQLGATASPAFALASVQAPIAAALSKVVSSPAPKLAPQSSSSTPAPAAIAVAVTSSAPAAASTPTVAAPVDKVASSAVKGVVSAPSTTVAAAAADSAKKGIKRKSDTEAPKSAKKPPTAPKPAVTPAAGSSKPLTSIFAKKITSFLVSPSPSAVPSSGVQAVVKSPQQQAKETGAKSPNSEVIEIDMD